MTSLPISDTPRSLRNDRNPTYSASNEHCEPTPTSTGHRAPGRGGVRGIGCPDRGGGDPGRAAIRRGCCGHGHQRSQQFRGLARVIGCRTASAANHHLVCRWVGPGPDLRPGPDRGSPGRDTAHHARGHRLRGGLPVPGASWSRCPWPAAGIGDQLIVWSGDRRRLDTDHAIRQERPGQRSDQRRSGGRSARSFGNAKAAGDSLGSGLGEQVLQGPDPGQVPQHRVLRRRGLRRGGRIPTVLRHPGQGHEPGAGGHVGRDRPAANRVRSTPASTGIPASS